MGIVLGLKNFNYMLEIDILGNYLQNFGGVPGLIFEGLGVQMTPRRPAGYDIVFSSDRPNLEEL